MNNPVLDSILTSIKKINGIPAEYDHFDAEYVMHINSIFTILYQLGVGERGFMIDDSSTSWQDYLGDDLELFQIVKTYMALRVRMLFDPPSSSTIAESYRQSITEMEWRITALANPKEDKSNV